jgi:hypothetical protein
MIVNGRSPADAERAVATLKAESRGRLGFANHLATAEPIEDRFAAISASLRRHGRL